MGVPTSGAFAPAGDGLVFFPEHRDEGDAGFDEAARHDEAGGVDGGSVALEGAWGFAFDVEGSGRAAGGEELEGALLLARVVAHGIVVVEFAAHFGHRTEDGFAVVDAFWGEALSEREGGRGELERLFEAAVQEKRVVLHADTACELAGAGVRRLAWFVGEGDDAGEFFGAFHLHADDAAHVGPVGGVGASVVTLLFEGDVRFVSGEVEIIACVMVAGGASEVGHAVDEGESVRVFCEEREVFAELDIGSGGADGLELASVLNGGVGFHVPHVDVGGASAEEEEDGGFGRFAPWFDVWRGGGRFAEGETEAGGGGSREEGAAAEA